MTVKAAGLRGVRAGRGSAIFRTGDVEIKIESGGIHDDRDDEWRCGRPDRNHFHGPHRRGQGLFDKVPLESQSSSLSSLVTLTTAGVAADSNGLFHGLGDHASNSFSVDGQPITDQQSKIFSNQLPSDAVESLEVIEGAPPAEYGDKTSLVIVATTRSGTWDDRASRQHHQFVWKFWYAYRGI